MNRHLLLLTLVALTVSSGTRAAVVSRDWKTPGDGLLTYDDVNRREWLDLTESRLSMFPGTTFEQRYQNALVELQPGGMFEGFAAAKSADLIAFAQFAGIDTTTDSYPANHTAVEMLIARVGVSYGPSANGGVASFGVLDQTSAPPQFPAGIRLTGELYVFPSSGPAGQAALLIAPDAGDTLVRPDNLGIWLHHVVVPEPNASVTISIGLLVAITFAFVRHQRRVALAGIFCVPLACRQCEAGSPSAT